MIKKELWFYNLCNIVSHRSIIKAIQCGITPSNIVKMDLNDFAYFYGVKKSEVFERLKEFANNYECSIENLSIYSLLEFNVSINILENVYQKGLTNVITLCLLPERIIKEKYNLSDLEYKKMIDAIQLMELEKEIDYNSEYVEDYISSFQDNEIYIEEIKKYINSIFDNLTHPINVIEILDKLPFIYRSSNNVYKVLKELLNAKKIILTKDGYIKRVLSIDEFVDMLPEDDRKTIYLKKYLSGQTYEEIGSVDGYTRELVRQQLNKIKYPKLKEDDLLVYFNEYSFTEEAFCKIFDVNKHSYRYIVFKSKKTGTKDFDELLFDSKISTEIKKRIEEVNPKYVYINGVKYLKKMTILFQYYTSRYLIEPKTIDNIVKDFIMFWEDLLSETFEHSNRSLKHIIETSGFTILNKHGMWRYYDIKSTDVDDLFDELNLKEYENKEVSAKIIYNHNRNMMKRYDIRDEYELHNLMRKSEKFNNVDFGRVPTIIFGSGNRDEQIEDLLLEMSPVDQNVLVDVYYNRYGFSKASALTYIFSKFSQYYYNGKYDLSLKILDENEINLWKNILTKNLYFHEELKQIAIDNGMKFDKHHLMKANLDRIGYVSNSSYIYSKKYDGAYYYFKELLGKDFINLDDIDIKIRSLVAFSDVLYEKFENMELFEYVHRNYISVNKLNDFGITIGSLNDFVNEVYNYVGDDIFTIYKLRKDGFYHPLFALEFDDIFYSSILRNSNKFLFKRVGTNNSSMLLMKNIDNYLLTAPKIVEQIVDQYGSIKLNDVFDIIVNQYGITLNEYKIKEYIKDTDIYLDLENLILYKKYDLYLESKK